MMNKDNVVHICYTCKKEFPTLKSLYGHQRVHPRERQLERLLKKKKPSFSPGQGTSSSVDLGWYSQNDKYHFLSRDPTESTSFKNTTTFPPFNSGVTRDNTSYGFSSGTPLVTHNHNHPSLSNRLGGVSFGPFKSGGGGSSRGYPYPLFNGGITRAPHATPYRSLTKNTSYGSSSRVPLPSYRYNNSRDHSLGSANSIGRFSNNNNNNNNNGSSQGSLSLDLSLGPSKSMGDSSNNSSSQGSLSLALSLGPSNSTSASNNNSSAFSSLIAGGETRNMDIPVQRPGASRFHFHSRNPLDSITRNVPLSHPPPITNVNRLVRPRASRFHFHSHNPLDSILRNVPLSHPHPTTNLPDDANVSGSSLTAKEKDVVVIDDDDEKDNVVTGDHD